MHKRNRPIRKIWAARWKILPILARIANGKDSTKLYIKID
jgi:hypothetical protein